MNRFAVLAVPAIAAACATAPAPIVLSAPLRAPEGEQSAFILAAEGVQIYACKPKAADPASFEWAFVAPQATLMQHGKTVGRHGAGPTWVATGDASSVKGTVAERQDGGSGNIPWLLLRATPSDNQGIFAGVTSIQRVDTKGGVEPAAPCDATKSGQEVRVPYTANYNFYKRHQ
ncbi:MAG: DUF3455 domain-containing protein [Usitatibacter sp.]